MSEPDGYRAKTFAIQIEFAQTSGEEKRILQKQNPYILKLHYTAGVEIMGYCPEARLRLVNQIALNLLEQTSVQNTALAGRIAREWVTAARRRKGYVEA